MKLALVLLVLATLFVPVYSRADAASSREIRVQPHPAVVQTFHLQVTGQPGPGTTFWVAYGPLGGRFGVIQLRASGSGVYAATARLPGAGRTAFVYLTGHGSMWTRGGLVPGDPVATIKTMGPVFVPRTVLPTVRWQASAG